MQTEHNQVNGLKDMFPGLSMSVIGAALVQNGNDMYAAFETLANIGDDQEAIKQLRELGRIMVNKTQEKELEELDNLNQKEKEEVQKKMHAETQKKKEETKEMLQETLFAMEHTAKKETEARQKQLNELREREEAIKKKEEEMKALQRQIAETERYF
eukprot:TRINITY_DN9797_c0_g1_i1.p1 TRINITY_DN9797_c0_g1~~TRINITY_DN9797_c0_g1_i1.p1  ORF type:complete len:157 (-),score=43.52 TRINITY_DN9797_c0_g1_i1:20-490(-)